LALVGPMMAFGSGTHERSRPTSLWPSKSAVTGLIGAALGRDYQDDMQDLYRLRVHVRIDAPGVVGRDLQTVRGAMRANGTVNEDTLLVDREHLFDAAFLVVIDGDPVLIGQISEALKNPCFPLCLGLKSCPAQRPVWMQDPDGRGAAQLLSELPDLTLRGGLKLTYRETLRGRMVRHDQPLPGRQFTSRTLSMQRVQVPAGAVPDFLLEAAQDLDVPDLDASQGGLWGVGG